MSGAKRASAAAADDGGGGRCWYDCVEEKEAEAPRACFIASSK